MSYKRTFAKADASKPRLKTSAMIASIAGADQKTKPAPFGHALVELAKNRPDIVGMSDTTVLHMQNFFDCVRSRKETNCPFDLGFRSAVACRMAVESYRQGRTVQWDEQKEEIV